MSLNQVLQVPGPKHMLDNVTQSFLQRLQNFAPFADSRQGVFESCGTHWLFFTFPTFPENVCIHVCQITSELAQPNNLVCTLQEILQSGLHIARQKRHPFRTNCAAWLHCCTLMTTGADWWMLVLLTKC